MRHEELIYSLPQLPSELVNSILLHLMALKIQNFYLCHLRKKKSRAASLITSHLCRYHNYLHLRGNAKMFTDTFRSFSHYKYLSTFYTIRREWRTEPHSWLHASHGELKIIVDECQKGYFGKQTALLSASSPKL